MLLVDYNDVWHIELLMQNADKTIVSHLILEKGCYASLCQFKEDLQEHVSSFLISYRKEWQIGSAEKTLMAWILML